MPWKNTQYAGLTTLYLKLVSFGPGAPDDVADLTTLLCASPALRSLTLMIDEIDDPYSVKSPINIPTRNPVVLSQLQTLELTLPLPHVFDVLGGIKLLEVPEKLLLVTPLESSLTMAQQFPVSELVGTGRLPALLFDNIRGLTWDIEDQLDSTSTLCLRGYGTTTAGKASTLDVRVTLANSSFDALISAMQRVSPMANLHSLDVQVEMPCRKPPSELKRSEGPLGSIFSLLAHTPTVTTLGLRHPQAMSGLLGDSPNLVSLEQCTRLTELTIDTSDAHYSQPPSAFHELAASCALLPSLHSLRLISAGFGSKDYDDFHALMQRLCDP